MSPTTLPNESTNRDHRKSIVREYLEAVGLAIILALIMRTSIVQAYVIPSGSMIPTLQVGDHIIVDKIRYGIRVPDSVFGLKVPVLPLGHIFGDSNPCGAAT